VLKEIIHPLEQFLISDLVTPRMNRLASIKRGGKFFACIDLDILRLSFVSASVQVLPGYIHAGIRKTGTTADWIDFNYMSDFGI
jgi:hypothetical protein